MRRVNAMLIDFYDLINFESWDLIDFQSWIDNIIKDWIKTKYNKKEILNENTFLKYFDFPKIKRTVFDKNEIKALSLFINLSQYNDDIFCFINNILNKKDLMLHLNERVNEMYKDSFLYYFNANIYEYKNIWNKKIKDDN